MSRFFPKAAYAEDQSYPKSILTVHVLTRGATSGAIVGAGIFAVRDLLVPRFKKTPMPTLSPGFQAAAPAGRRLLPVFLRTSGTATVWGIILSAIALEGRMWGREKIEWADRSYRLVHNKYQEEVDDFTYGTAVLGVGAAAASGALKGSGWRGAVGAAGSASIVGTVGYMVWRHGIKGGKFAADGKPI